MKTGDWSWRENHRVVNELSQPLVLLVGGQLWRLRHSGTEIDEWRFNETTKRSRFYVKRTISNYLRWEILRNTYCIQSIESKRTRKQSCTSKIISLIFQIFMIKYRIIIFIFGIAHLKRHFHFLEIRSFAWNCTCVEISPVTWSACLFT